MSCWGYRWCGRRRWDWDWGYYRWNRWGWYRGWNWGWRGYY